MNERLQYLLNRYLSKKAEPLEIEEFEQLAAQPENEALIKSEIEKALASPANNTLTAENTGNSVRDSVGEEIYARIRQQHRINTPRQFPLQLLITAAAALVIIAVGLAWHFSGSSGLVKLDHSMAIKSGDDQPKTYANKNYIRLPDGSSVLLKDSSELFVVEKNGQFQREVILKGEAFFDIAHDPAHSFIVHTGKITTRVLGTAFNVRSQNGKLQVKVTRGLVEVGADHIIFGKLKAKEQIEVNTDSNVFSITPLKPVEKIIFQNTALTFEETNLADVFERIGTKYGYQIFLENSELSPCRISAKFAGDDDLDYVLGTICAMRNLEYSIELDKILIKGGISCK
jgi:transmembrane sensor